MRSLRQCLLDTDAVVLRVIAERWSLNPIGLKPRDLVDRLEETISAPARATVILDDLPGVEREALRTLLAASGTLPVANFSQRFGSIRSVGPARLEREQLWRTPISPAENLWYLGLLYRGFEQLPNGAMREVFFAPAELAPHHYPRQLSGGQEQRVAIARAIVTDPAILVADEPTGDLDKVSAEEVLALMERLNRELDKTILMVTHDPRAAERASSVRQLEKGELA